MSLTTTTPDWSLPPSLPPSFPPHSLIPQPAQILTPAESQLTPQPQFQNNSPTEDEVPPESDVASHLKELALRRRQTVRNLQKQQSSQENDAKQENRAPYVRQADSSDSQESPKKDNSKKASRQTETSRNHLQDYQAKPDASRWTETEDRSYSIQPHANNLIFQSKILAFANMAQAASLFSQSWGMPPLALTTTAIAKQALISSLPEAQSNILMKCATSPWTMATASLLKQAVPEFKWVEGALAAASTFALARNLWKKKDEIGVVTAAAFVALNAATSALTIATPAVIGEVTPEINGEIINSDEIVNITPVREIVSDAIGKLDLQFLSGTVLALLNTGITSVAAVATKAWTTIQPSPPLENWSLKNAENEIQRSRDAKKGTEETVRDCRNMFAEFKGTTPREWQPHYDIERATREYLPWNWKISPSELVSRTRERPGIGQDTDNKGKVWKLFTHEKYLEEKEWCNTREGWLKDWSFYDENYYRVLELLFKKKELQAYGSDRFERWRQTQEILEVPLVLTKEEVENFKKSPLTEEKLESFVERTLTWWKELYSRWNEAQALLGRDKLPRKQEFEEWYLSAGKLSNRFADEQWYLSAGKLSDMFQFRSIEEAKEEIPSVQTLHTLYKNDYNSWLKFRETIESKYPPERIQQYEESYKPNKELIFNALENELHSFSAEQLLSNWEKHFPVWLCMQRKIENPQMTEEEENAEWAKYHRNPTEYVQNILKNEWAKSSNSQSPSVES